MARRKRDIKTKNPKIESKCYYYSTVDDFKLYILTGIRSNLLLRLRCFFWNCYHWECEFYVQSRWMNDDFYIWKKEKKNTKTTTMYFETLSHTATILFFFSVFADVPCASAPIDWQFNAIRSSISKVFESCNVESMAPWAPRIHCHVAKRPFAIQSWNDGKPNDRKQYDLRDSKTIKLNKYLQACVIRVRLCLCFCVCMRVYACVCLCLCVCVCRWFVFRCRF